MFVDKAKILIKAGDGGHGAVAFHREKYIASGGPAETLFLLLTATFQRLPTSNINANIKLRTAQTAPAQEKAEKMAKTLLSAFRRVRLSEKRKAAP